MRRVLWNLYAWPITALLTFLLYSALWPKFELLPTLDAIISAPSLLALHCHIWDKRVGTATFWKPYAVLLLVWDLAFNLWLSRMGGSKVGRLLLIAGLLYVVPVYVGTVRYAYRKWPKQAAPEPLTMPSR